MVSGSYCPPTDDLLEYTLQMISESVYRSSLTAVLIQ